jgi:hypothetical protein
MKRVMVACVLAVFATISASATARPNLDFKLINKTGLTIDQVYVSPSDDDEWGEDVLGQDVLGNGESVDIEFSRKETKCKWDLKVVDSDKDEIEWTEIDLCKAEEITLKYEGKKPTALIK